MPPSAEELNNHWTWVAAVQAASQAETLADLADTIQDPNGDPPSMGKWKDAVCARAEELYLLMWKMPPPAP